MSTATKEVLTISRLKTLRECAQKHHLKYVDLWEPTTRPERLAFGTLFHVGVETFWNAIKNGFNVATGLDLGVAAIHSKSSDEIQDKFVLAVVLELFRGYCVSWEKDATRYEVLEVEAQFSSDLINPESMRASQTFALEGKIDLIVREKLTGRVLLVEHKTTKEDVSDDAATYWSRLTMDPQLSTYVVGAIALGYAIDAIIYDVAGKPQLRPHKATPIESRKYTKEGKLYAAQRAEDETLVEFTARVAEDVNLRADRYFRRREVVRLDGELQANMKDVWHDARILRESQLAGRHPRNPDACHKFGKCEFFDICANGVDPAFSSQFRRRASAHTELANVGEALEV